MSPPDERARRRAELRARVDEAIERQVRPKLRSHFGDVAVKEITDDGAVVLEYEGACVSCPARATTLGLGIKPVLDEVEGVTGVTATTVWVSPQALERMAAAHRRSVQRRASSR